MATFRTVQGNTSPTYTLTLERDSGTGTATAIDLTGASVVLIIKGGGVITNAGSVCVVSSAAGGIIQYTPVAADFPSPGTYKADAKITFADASVEIVYEQAKFKARAKLA